MMPGLALPRPVLLRPPRGRSKLPVVELDKTSVEKPYKRLVRPIHSWPSDPAALLTSTLGHAKAELNIRAWSLCHAAAKTELARGWSADALATAAWAFVLNTDTLLNWNPQNLRLLKDGVFSRKDSARTALAGRMGDAIAYLFMLDKGYVYWDHLPALIERAFNKNAIPHEDQLRIAAVIKSRLVHKGPPDKQPDFAFETASRQIALAEAKGAFVPPDCRPRAAKGDLAYGLKQLAAWQSFIKPAPHKSFAIGTYLREIGDPYPDPSLIAFVDPEDDIPSDRYAEFPEDWIRRGNYGAWLIGMGLTTAGIALRNGETAEVTRRELLVLPIGKHLFAVVTDELPGTYLWQEPFWDLPMSRYHRLASASFDIHVSGIEVDNLRHIERAVSPETTALPNDMVVQASAVAEFPDWFSGSILPDGTLFGALHIDRHPFPMLDTVTFRL
jgi:hypothetical protein